MKSIEISRLRLDGGTQPRAELNRETVDEYADAFRGGAIFPPVIAFYDGADYWLADGFHRVSGAKMAGRAMIDVDLKQGTRRDAVLFSCGANHGHGLRRTNADKRRSVETLLKDEEWAKWSDRAIAEKCAVSHPFVLSLRPKPTGGNGYHPEERKGKDGKSYPASQPKKEEKKPAPAAKPEPRYCPKCGAEVDAAGSCAACQAEAEEARRKAAEAKAAEDSETKFNRTNQNVEWALWTWNPVTGCLHDCDYCYARDVAERFYPQKFVPTIHPARFGASSRTPRPSDEKVALPYDEAKVAGGLGEKNVFTCSMADLFGKWVPDEWIERVLDEIRSAPQWNFLLLTKFPQRLVGIDFPDNAWIGTTVDTQARVKAAENAFEKVKARVKWLSCEPMLERLTFSRIHLFDWIVIGGASRSTQTPEFRPPFEWAANLYRQASTNDVAVYMKTNLLDRVREYPG